jgi:hypothetical protein
LNPGETNGQLFVTINGQKIPRYVSGVTASGDAYYTEVSNNTIQLDSDYSGYSYNVEIIKWIGLLGTDGGGGANQYLSNLLSPTSVNQILNMSGNAIQGNTVANGFLTLQSTSHAGIANKGAVQIIDGSTLILNNNPANNGSWAILNSDGELPSALSIFSDSTVNANSPQGLYFAGTSSSCTGFEWDIYSARSTGASPDFTSPAYLASGDGLYNLYVATYDISNPGIICAELKVLASAAHSHGAHPTKWQFTVGPASGSAYEIVAFDGLTNSIQLPTNANINLGGFGYNFNFPTTSGNPGQLLKSGGGGSAPMTWGPSVGSIPTGTYTILSTDDTLFVTGPTVLTLPDATANNGKTYTIFNHNGATNTINAAGTDVIVEGSSSSASTTSAVQGEAIIITSVGGVISPGEWLIISRYS